MRRRRLWLSVSPRAVVSALERIPAEGLPHSAAASDPRGEQERLLEHPHKLTPQVILEQIGLGRPMGPFLTLCPPRVTPDPDRRLEIENFQSLIPVPVIRTKTAEKYGFVAPFCGSKDVACKARRLCRVCGSRAGAPSGRSSRFSEVGSSTTSGRKVIGGSGPKADSRLTIDRLRSICETVVRNFPLPKRRHCRGLAASHFLAASRGVRPSTLTHRSISVTAATLSLIFASRLSASGESVLFRVSWPSKTAVSPLP